MGHFSLKFKFRRFVLLCLALGLLVAAAPRRAHCADKKETATPRISALAISPNHKLLASAGTEAVDGQPDKRVVRLWDLGKRQQIHSYTISAKEITALAFSKESGRLCAGDDTGALSVWFVSSHNGRPVTQDGKAGVSMALFDPRDSNIAYFDGQLRLWGDGRRVSTRPLPDGASKPGAAEFLLDGSHLGIAVERRTLLLHPVNFSILSRIGEHAQPVTALTFHFTEGLYMASGHADGGIEYWQAGKRQQLGKFRGHGKAVTNLAFYDKNRRLVSTGADGLIRFWDQATGKQLGEVRASKQPLLPFALSRDRTILATADGPTIALRTLDPEQPSQVASLIEFDGTAGPAAPIALTSETLADPNRLRHWKVVRGDWKEDKGHLTGSGDSRIELKQELPNDITVKFKLKVHGETNPRVRFDAFHFGYEGRKHQFFLHGPQATGTPFPFELEQEYQIEVAIAGPQATLSINGKQVAQSSPKTNESRTLAFEGGGKRSQGSTEFYEIEITVPPVADETSGKAKRAAGKGK